MTGEAARDASSPPANAGPTPADLGLDPSDPAFIADPYPVLRTLRDRHPVLWNPITRQWLIARHASVDRLLREHQEYVMIEAAGKLRENTERH